MASGLLWWRFAHAEKLSYENEIYKTDTAVYYKQGDGIPDEKSWDEYQVAQQKKIRANQAKSVVSNQGPVCSCVSWVNWKYGTNLKTLDGYARSIPTNSKEPAMAGFVITRESWAGHVGRYILDGDYLVLTESNYSKCRVTVGRRLSIFSPLIIGYIN